MSSMKRRARDKGSGKYSPEAPVKVRGRPNLKKKVEEIPAEKKRAGRPRSKKPKDAGPLPTLEVSVTISVGGGDIDRGLFPRINAFLVDKTQAGKCSIERGGAAFHLHFQMVARLQARSIIAVSKLVKSFLGWDVTQPVGGMVLCRKLTNKRLHTFHGLLGYCMKDVSKEHFETVDHNVSAQDISLGLEQYALFGQEENKNRVALTMQNIVNRVFMWRKYNCSHPLIVDFSRDLFDMLKTGRYYPAPSWVIAGYGKGYEPYRMQSLYRIMVTPMETTRQDVKNVFEAPDNERSTPRREWFESRWEEQPGEKDTEEKAKECNVNDNIDVLCDAALQTSPLRQRIHTKKQRKRSPTHYLWPEEWRVTSPSSSSDGPLSHQTYDGPHPDYVPLHGSTGAFIAAV
eukprot:c25305_g3_i1 orf=628-1830(+)